MSQQIFSDIDPEVTTGLMLAALLDDFKDALMSGMSGTARPVSVTAGGIWIDTSQEEAPTFKWSMKIYTGTVDREILSVDLLTGASGFNIANDVFTVRRISADDVGAILNLMKARIETAGQVAEDDLIARFRFLGHTNSDADVLTAYMQAVSEEDMTSSERGVIFSFHSTPEGSNSVLEHLRFVAGICESVVPHKFNSWNLVTDSVVGSTNMVVTDDKVITEITGASGVNIHGVEAEDASTQYKVIVNSGSVDLLLKHQSVVADAEERLKLPDSNDIVIPPNGSVTLLYCITDTRWKYISGAGLHTDYLKEIRGGYTEWVAPFTGCINLVAYTNEIERIEGSAQANSFAMSDLDRIFSWGINAHGQLGLNDVTPRSAPVLMAAGLTFRDCRVGETSSWGKLFTGENYAWGRNQHGQLGVGDVTPRSSPVAVVGGLTLKRVEIKESSYGIRGTGDMYAWGLNTNGQLGLGDVTPRSSPVAVLGGLKFSEFYTGADGENRIFAVDKTNGDLYAWGDNSNGSLGVGNVVPRSSPVAVLGGLKFTKVAVGDNSAVGIIKTGELYSWGVNANGQLGVGDVVPRSSPVAVLSGLKFTNVVVLSAGSYLATTEDGTAYAWGENTFGQLGDGTTIDKSSPVAVLGGLKFGKIALLPANGSVIAIEKGSDLAYAWGKNSSGELGVGDITNRSSPVAVLLGLKFTEVKMGAAHAYGFTPGGVYSWGENANGQLGLGDVAKRSSPVVVLGTGFLNPLLPKPSHSLISVTKGSTYVIRLGGAVAMFGEERIGTNIGRITIAYYN